MIRVIYVVGDYYTTIHFYSPQLSTELDMIYCLRNLPVLFEHLR
ncbi:MAG: hypothetical protein SFV22_13280 [Saprospiraceae bacterium]|nr:hypothetical protein [Saprospiraceae bacterium]